MLENLIQQDGGFGFIVFLVSAIAVLIVDAFNRYKKKDPKGFAITFSIAIVVGIGFYLLFVG